MLSLHFCIFRTFFLFMYFRISDFWIFGFLCSNIWADSGRVWGHHDSRSYKHLAPNTQPCLYTRITTKTLHWSIIKEYMKRPIQTLSDTSICSKQLRKRRALGCINRWLLIITKVHSKGFFQDPLTLNGFNKGPRGVCNTSVVQNWHFYYCFLYLSQVTIVNK